MTAENSTDRVYSGLSLYEKGRALYSVCLATAADPSVNVNELHPRKGGKPEPGRYGVRMVKR